MKKTFYLKTALILFATGVFASCSKEKILLPETTVQRTTETMKQWDPVKSNGNLTGMVIGKVSKASITLYNNSSEKAYGPFYLNTDGSFKILDIPAGTYKLVLTWVDYTTNPAAINGQLMSYTTEVSVDQGSTTILPPIFL